MEGRNGERISRTIPGIMIGAVKSGSGKTTVTCALLEALRERGLHPRAFKCGPDYIDPMFHRTVLEIPSRNLDGFFSGPEALRRLYAEGMNGGGVAVVEAAMGLYDGLGGIREEGSAYETACALDLPILLVVDAHGMGRSLIPLLAGFLQYDREKRIAGVVLNKISESFFQSIKTVIQEELGLPVLGFLPKFPDLVLESRHLGLKLPEEIQDLREKMRRAARVLENGVAVEQVLEIAGGKECSLRAGTAEASRMGEAAGMAEDSRTGEIAGTAEASRMMEAVGTAANVGKAANDTEAANGTKTANAARPVRIGVARDEAFCFYYEENLRMLEAFGAELVPFSPLHDPNLPDGLQGLLLGGGYPELYASQLEANASMREAIGKAIRAGIPSLAECGGFLYLHETLRDENGVSHAMCGVVPGSCFYTGKLVRFGYVTLEKNGGEGPGTGDREYAGLLKLGEAVKGHEFHYYDSENNGRDCTASKPATGRSWECIHSGPHFFWGFPHLYYPSCPELAERFVEAGRRYPSSSNI